MRAPLAEQELEETQSQGCAGLHCLSAPEPRHLDKTGHKSHTTRTITPHKTQYAQYMPSYNIDHQARTTSQCRDYTQTTHRRAHPWPLPYRHSPHTITPYNIHTIHANTDYTTLVPCTLTPHLCHTHNTLAPCTYHTHDTHMTPHIHTCTHMHTTERPH